VNSQRIIHGYELAYTEDPHGYLWNGSPVPGVTSILKVVSKGPKLEGWIKNQVRDHWLTAVTSGRTDFQKIHKESWGAGDKTSKAAADIGKNVHYYAECFFKNLPLPVLETDEAKRSVEAFHDWLNKHNVAVKASELLVYSKEHNYAGTTDFVAEIDGTLAVGDIKTSSGIFPEMRLQTAAYQHAIQEEKTATTGKPFRFEVRWIVRFDKKTGEFEAKPFYDFELDFQGFQAALTLHRTLQALAG
jgi:hypothetical protein